MLNIMIVGVGGQGSLLASRILGNALMLGGEEVKVSEVHGMSQRGGSVVTYVKSGERVDSPVICEGEADVILSFEELEAARWLPFLKKGGVIVTSTQQIMPMPVITGAAVYPDAVSEKLKAKGVKLIAADALALAREAGNEKAANVALIGLLSNYMPIPTETLEKALEMSVPAKLLEVNKKAYAIGRAAAEAAK